jgi:CHAD domain-containing protein
MNHFRPAPAETLEQIAKRVFAELYQAILAQEEGVRARDAEAVHQMRVASRRLRVALSNFAACCEPNERRRMRAILGQLADALGGVRDLDVLIEALKQYQTSLPSNEQKNIAALIRRLQARRRRRRHQLDIFLGSEDYAHFKRDFLSPRQPVQVVEQQPQVDYGQTT